MTTCTTCGQIINEVVTIDGLPYAPHVPKISLESGSFLHGSKQVIGTRQRQTMMQGRQSRQLNFRKAGKSHLKHGLNLCCFQQHMLNNT